MDDVILRLRECRESCGLTQQQLGECIGVARQTVAAWEKAESSPNLAQMLRIARVLGVNLELLLHQPVESEPSLLFRADQPQVLAPAIRSKLQIQTSNYAQIEKMLGEAPALPESRPLDDFSSDIVEDAATSVREWIGVKDGPICDAISLLEDKGLKIFLWTLPKVVSGFSAYTDELGGAIVINSIHPVERQSFTALHEVAHLIFHRSDYQRPSTNGSCEYPKEKAANRFAGAVLLPRPIIEREMRAYRGRWIPESLLAHLKQRYCVSMRTVLMRCADLKIVTKELAGRMIGVLDRKYGKTQEPFAIKRFEVMSRLNRLALEGVVQGRITMSRAAEVLEVPLADLRSQLESLTEGGST